MQIKLLRFQDKSKWRSLYEKSKEQYWTPEAVDCQPDKNQWLTLDKALKRKVMALLQYAIILDSYQVSNLQKEGQAAALSGDPMLSALLSFHSLMEVVHSQSYSYWAETVCTPKQKTWLYQQSAQAESRLAAYESLNKIDSQLANYFLEGVSFQALFRLSDQLKSEGLLSGLSAILNLIKRDEATHIETFQYLLNSIIKTFDDRTKTFWASEFKTAVEYEAQQIFNLTQDQLLSDYVLYAGELRAKAIGLLEKVTAKNPLKSLESYNDTSKQNLKANFFTSNVMYEQRDESLDWNTDTWFSS
jgi:ribonucleotide reductase beta subunit family protein with ferritin-like domain